MIASGAASMRQNAAQRRAQCVHDRRLDDLAVRDRGQPPVPGRPGRRASARCAPRTSRGSRRRAAPSPGRASSDCTARGSSALTSAERAPGPGAEVALGDSLVDGRLEPGRLGGLTTAARRARDHLGAAWQRRGERRRPAARPRSSSSSSAGNAAARVADVGACRTSSSERILMPRRAAGGDAGAMSFDSRGRRGRRRTRSRHDALPARAQSSRRLASEWCTYLVRHARLVECLAHLLRTGAGLDPHELQQCSVTCPRRSSRDPSIPGRYRAPMAPTATTRRHRPCARPASAPSWRVRAARIDGPARPRRLGLVRAALAQRATARPG